MKVFLHVVFICLSAEAELIFDNVAIFYIKQQKFSHCGPQCISFQFNLGRFIFGRALQWFGGNRKATAHLPI